MEPSWCPGLESLPLFSHLESFMRRLRNLRMEHPFLLFLCQRFELEVCWFRFLDNLLCCGCFFTPIHFPFPAAGLPSLLFSESCSGAAWSIALLALVVTTCNILEAFYYGFSASLFFFPLWAFSGNFFAPSLPIPPPPL